MHEHLEKVTCRNRHEHISHFAHRAAHCTITAYGHSLTVTGTAVAMPYCKKYFSTVWYGEGTALNGHIAMYSMLATGHINIMHVFVSERINKHAHSFTVAAS